MAFKIHDMAKNAKGGTELMAQRLEESLLEHSPDLLEFFDFYCSRVVDYDPNKPSIYIVHDLAEDPEVQHLRNGGDKKFDLIVFVSNWQYQQYQERFNLDGRNCVVINNGIEVPELVLRGSLHHSEKVKLIYHTTPHRGLHILFESFKEIYKERQDIELDVYSSFAIYGWEERNEPFKQLFKDMEKYPGVNYHGSVPNEEVRDALAYAHIFAYPSIWRETSCLALIEAMMFGVSCVHSNYGALIETSGGLTTSYPFKINPQDHIEYFTQILNREINEIRSPSSQKSRQLIEMERRAAHLYDWGTIQHKWIAVLTQLKKALVNQ